MHDELVDTLRHMALPHVQALGLSIWGLEVLGGAGRKIVRLFVDGPEGVDVEALARISRQLSVVLDVEDPIQTPFTLEVSSPGLERRFFEPGQMAGYTGRSVELTLHAARDGRRVYAGPLVSVEGEDITLSLGEAAAVFAWPDLKKARLIHFDTPAKSASDEPSPKKKKAEKRS